MNIQLPRSVLPVLLFAALTACGGDTSVCISFNTERNLCQLPAPGQSNPKPGGAVERPLAGEDMQGQGAETGPPSADAASRE